MTAEERDKRDRTAGVALLLCDPDRILVEAIGRKLDDGLDDRLNGAIIARQLGREGSLSGAN